MISKYLTKNFYTNFFIIIFLFIIDRISKFYVIYRSQKNLDPEIYTSSFLNIILIWNNGIAFGLLSSDNNYFYNSITILITIIVIILIFLISKSKSFTKFAYILVTGGALGNLFDRLLYKSVPDFLDLHYNDFHWFIFNIADIFITLGIICLIYDEFFLEKKDND